MTASDPKEPQPRRQDVREEEDVCEAVEGQENLIVTPTTAGKKNAEDTQTAIKENTSDGFIGTLVVVLSLLLILNATFWREPLTRALMSDWYSRANCMLFCGIVAVALIIFWGKNMQVLRPQTERELGCLVGIPVAFTGIMALTLAFSEYDVFVGLLLNVLLWCCTLVLVAIFRKELQYFIWGKVSKDNIEKVRVWNSFLKRVWWAGCVLLAVTVLVLFERWAYLVLLFLMDLGVLSTTAWKIYKAARPNWGEWENDMRLAILIAGFSLMSLLLLFYLSGLIELASQINRGYLDPVDERTFFLLFLIPIFCWYTKQIIGNSTPACVLLLLFAMMIQAGISDPSYFDLILPTMVLASMALDVKIFATALKGIHNGKNWTAGYKCAVSFLTVVVAALVLKLYILFVFDGSLAATHHILLLHVLHAGMLMTVGWPKCTGKCNLFDISNSRRRGDNDEEKEEDGHGYARMRDESEDDDGDPKGDPAEADFV